MITPKIFIFSSAETCRFLVDEKDLKKWSISCHFSRISCNFLPFPWNEVFIGLFLTFKV